MKCLFVNPHGKLCFEVTLFGKPLYTRIGVTPRFDGYDVNGNIINLNDWSYV